MAKKIFTYQGKTLEELQAMSLTDLAELFPSRQRRKIKRGFTAEEKKFLDTITKKNNVKTHLRDMIVLPVMIGKTIKIHSGKEFISVIVQEETLGCRLGELVLTRKKTGHSSPGVGATKPASSGKVAVK